jgi:2'-5' RNA ligase
VSDTPRLRLFVAVAIPAPVLAALDDAIAPHRDLVPGARWAPLANQHVTLKFLGHVPAERSPAIEGVCAEVARTLQPADISVEGLGAFPNAKRARVLWAGIGDPVGLLTTMAARLDIGLQPLGFEPEDRDFTPHLTLARLKRPAPVRALLEQVEFHSESFRLDALSLYLSKLSPKGARYEVLESFVLGNETRSIL